MTRRAVALGLVALLLALPAGALAATPRASLTDIENDVMCVTCHEPLIEAQSPQAYEERDFIRQLIVQGQTKPQIERALVAQYGPAVLGKPPASGFDLTVYLLPAGIVVLVLVATALILPRWRHASGDASGASEPAISAAEARRLEEELRTFDI